MNVIVIQEEAYYSLLAEMREEVRRAVIEVRSELQMETTPISEQETNKWVNKEEAMEILGIRSLATLQKYRDEMKIVFSQAHNGGKIRYLRSSLDKFLESNIIKQ